MGTSTLAQHRSRSLAAAFVAAVVVAAVAAPVAAFNSGWTKPKLVFAASGSPSHSMVVSDGKVHIASEKGSSGIWYITNAGGPWAQCQVSSGNDRQPSIAVSGGVVHIAFARLSGEKGLYTASSDQEEEPASEGDCGWVETRRSTHPATHTSMAMYGSSLSIAFRTADKKLRFTKGNPADPTWTLNETIDGSCCTSAPDLALTHSGSPRVAYGDGTAKKAQGLKYAVRTSKGWKKSKASGGRVKHVAMALNLLPGIGKPPSSAPRIVFVVKGKGFLMAEKAASGHGGRWTRRTLGDSTIQPAITLESNVMLIIHGKPKGLWMIRTSGGIWTGGKLNGGAGHAKLQFDAGHLTFTRNKGTKGIYYTTPK